MSIEFQESDSVRNISGVGPAAQDNLLRLGLSTLHNVLEYYPRQYLDASQPLPLNRVPLAELVAVSGEIISSRKIHLRGKPMVIIEAKLSDGDEELTLRWFNQPYIMQKLVPGSHWICIGQVSIAAGKRAMINPILETSPRILAVYGQTTGLTSKALRDYVSWTLARTEFDPKYELPEEVRQSEQLLTRQEALRMVHSPQSMEEVEIGRRTVGFAEVFWFFMLALVAYENTDLVKAATTPLDTAFLQELVSKLPFTLTPGQKRSLWEIVQDFAGERPMTRLLNGEVGSGKTAVAALAATVLQRAGYQTALLVPTAILAQQHAESIARLLAPMGVQVACVTAKRRDSLERADLVVGTHALLQEGISLPRLGLIVVDEQHRFGVRQRRFLREQREGIVPHLLSMTATPIPRSLALALFSELKMSVIQEKPADRLPVETRIIHQNQRPVMHERILTELGAGRQVFVICPLIDESEVSPANERKTVLAEVERLRQENPEYGEIGVLHGRMKEGEKQSVMQRMVLGEINVLVATSVVEVGIDIPNATVIIIEGAERFGLSQLHQFRGRVGRSGLQSYCFLCPGIRSQPIDVRLETLVRFQSGFAIAEQDLELRGPGDLAGLAQSGLPQFKAVSLGDFSFLRHVKEVADLYVAGHPEFAQALRERSDLDTESGLE